MVEDTIKEKQKLEETIKVYQKDIKERGLKGCIEKGNSYDLIIFMEAARRQGYSNNHILHSLGW